MTHWIEVLLKIVDGPSIPVSGPARATHADTGPRTWYDGHYGIAPLHVGFGLAPMLLTRHGRGTRLETVDGTVKFITDGETAWVFDAGHETPVETAMSNIRVHDPGQELVVSRPVDRWVRGRFTRPTRDIEDVEFIGRRCWSVELDSEHDDEPPQRLVVDVETGAILHEDGQDGTAAFDHVMTRETVPESTFRWSGAIRTPRDWGAERRAEDAARQQQSMDWFRTTVTPDRVRATVSVDFTPTAVLRDPGDPEGFEATFEEGEGRLWRRTRSAEDWRLPRQWRRHSPAAIRGWSTQSHDWACVIGLNPDGLTDDSLLFLQRQLHPGESVVGTPTIA